MLHKYTQKNMKKQEWEQKSHEKGF